jgi:hypothetical protein
MLYNNNNKSSIVPFVRLTAIMISFGFILMMIATPSIIVLAQTNKTSSENVTTPLSSAGSTNASSSIAGGHIVNRTGFTYAYDVVLNGKTYPIKYNTTGGNLLALATDTNQKTLLAVIGSTADKGKLIIELPRIVIDAKGQDKGQQAGDAKFEVHIDKKPVEYKEIANSKDARIMQIDVSKNDRTIEIIGTRMAGQ